MNFDTKIRKNIIQGKIQNFEIKSTIVGYANKGNMQSSVYDPNQIVSDAFDMDNMIEGNENKILTSIERTKLEEIEEGAEVNVQSDMAQTDDTKDDFVKNKPTIVISGNDFNRTFDNLHIWFNITTPYLNKPSDMIQDTGNISVYMPYEGSSNTGIQVIHGTVGDDEGKIWMRRCNSGTWTKWKLVAGGGGFSVEAISNTTAATADKIATTASGDYIPKVGNVIKLVLTNANTANNVTLNIDNSGAKNITIGGNNAGNISINNAANGNILLLYDGTNYIMFGAVRNVDDNTTYSEISTTEITDGTASTTRSISGRRSQDIVNKAREKVIISTDETFKDFITKTQAEYNAMSSVERANKTIIVDEFDSSVIVIDNLTSTSPTHALSANMGNRLKPVTLWTGSSTTNITLNETVLNFARYIIYFTAAGKEWTVICQGNGIHGATISFSGSFGDPLYYALRIVGCQFAVNGTSVLPSPIGENYTVDLKSTGEYIFSDNETTITITKIEGFRE